MAILTGQSREYHEKRVFHHHELSSAHLSFAKDFERHLPENRQGYELQMKEHKDQVFYMNHHLAELAKLTAQASA